MEFDKNTYKVYKWKNWMYLHYIINPGLAFNELVLGQRIAKTGLVERNTGKPFVARNYIPCPHCNTLHGSHIWSGSRGFYNWFGLYCPNCKGIIPCIRNTTSFIVLAISSPLWYPFKNALKKSWYKKQEERFKNLQTVNEPAPYSATKQWVLGGLLFGLIMFVFNSFIFPLMAGQKILIENLAVSLAICLLGGLLFTLFMKWYLSSKKIN